MKKYGWSNLLEVFIGLLIISTFGVVIYGLSKGSINDNSSINKCTAPDAYGTHIPGDPPANCPDPKQKLTIERTGVNIGWYEYSCKCP